MSDEKRFKLSRLLGYIILFFLVAYVLSIGPVVGSLQTPQGTPLQYVPLLTAVYGPLVWVIDRVPFLEKVVQRYIEFCSPDFEHAPAP
ncbi:hypothetical protein [Gimesia fumaroli]|uniref:Uncharacterized protein n=1 Tax=Gimesia fumaroli TaxID=2527976 RepID=A0A518I8K7_9PLAN|nr:hypothetical protein [Gimesia fumaroli]QDV49443.1 hypothetical protein Enr17x_14610 [Gimesia fumaroli]